MVNKNLRTMNFNSKNPFLNNKTFSTATSRNNQVHQATVIDYNQEMTLSGTINKSLILFLLLCASAMVIWWMTFNGMNPISSYYWRSNCRIDFSSNRCIQTSIFSLFGSGLRLV